MNSLRTIRHRVLVMLLLAFLTSLTASGQVAAQEEDDLASAVERLCTTLQPPYIDDQCATAVRAATREAAGWPDYDPIAISEKGLQIEIARREAAEEAAGWPNYDPTALAGSAQIVQPNEAAAEAPLDTED